MRPSGARVRSLTPNRLAITLMVLLAALVLFGGCVRGRNTSTQGWSGVVTDGTSAFVGTKDGRIVQITLVEVDGRVIAQPGATFDPPEVDQNISQTFYGTPMLSNDRLYAGGYNGVVYSMRATPGRGGGGVLQDVAEFDIEGNPLAKSVAGSAVPVDDVIVVAVSEDAAKGRLLVLDAERLDQNLSAPQVERCRYPQGDPIGQLWTTPTVADGIAYFGDLSHRLHAVSIANCALVWNTPAELGGAIVAPPLVLGGKLYLGAFDRWFYEVDRATGAVTRLFEADGWFWARAATDGARVYAPSLDGTLYAYSVREKQVVWKYDQEGDPEPILSAPVVVDDKVVMASDSGIVTLLSSGGDRLDSFGKAGDDIRAPLSARDGVVYVHSLDEIVTALRIRGTRFSPEWSIDVSGE